MCSYPPPGTDLPSCPLSPDHFNPFLTSRPRMSTYYLAGNLPLIVPRSLRTSKEAQHPPDLASLPVSSLFWLPWRALLDTPTVCLPDSIHRPKRGSDRNQNISLLNTEEKVSALKHRTWLEYTIPQRWVFGASRHFQSDTTPLLSAAAFCRWSAFAQLSSKNWGPKPGLCCSVSGRP